MTPVILEFRGALGSSRDKRSPCGVQGKGKESPESLGSSKGNWRTPWEFQYSRGEFQGKEKLFLQQQEWGLGKCSERVITTQSDPKMSLISLESLRSVIRNGYSH